MKLVCPSCSSSFVVDSSALGAEGRTVRCGRCRHSWLAKPEPEEEPVLELHSPVEEPEEDPTPRLAEFDAERRRSREARRSTRQPMRRRSSAGGWVLFVLVVAAIVIGAVFGRHQVMAWVPETEKLYTLVGLAGKPPAVEAPEIQLRLQEITSSRQDLDGEPSLVVEGQIVNPTDQPQDVPPLVATLYDPQGTELKRWTFAVDVDVLPPGGRVAFQTSTDNPPNQGNLNLSFLTGRR